MKSLSVIALLALSFAGAVSLVVWKVDRAQAGDMLTYVQSPDSSFKWEKVSKDQTTSCPRYVLKMTSQTWHGIAWTNDMELFVPDKCQYPRTALLFVSADKPGGTDARYSAELALELGCPMAVLYGIPNQPICGGRTENTLVAYTCMQAVTTGDSTWPVLFPMTKAAVRAMDALQQFSKTELKSEIEGFVVIGHSKRGMATCLTAAADPTRVKAIIPMGFDFMKIPEQVRHQKECYGSQNEVESAFGGQGADTSAVLETSAGKNLMTIIDPWSYRDRMTMPKLLIQGTNEPAYVVDSLNIYWNDLKGPKYTFYVPNGGHGIGNFARATSALSAVALAVVSGAKLPELKWNHSTAGTVHKLDVSVDPKDATAVMWVASSDSRDFRKSVWTSQPMTATGTGFTSTVNLPAKGYKAVFGEVRMKVAGRPCALSTQVGVVGAVK